MHGKQSKKTKPRTRRQKAFIEALPTAKSMSDAARKAGYKDPGQSGWENKKKLEISDDLESVGLTNRQIAQNIMDATKAMKKIGAQVIVKDGKRPGRQEREVEYIEMEDWPSRLKANEIAIRLKDLNPSEKKEVKHSGKLTLADYLLSEGDEPAE
jgi:phage FluMu gp28-like protein